MLTSQNISVDEFNKMSSYEKNTAFSLHVTELNIKYKNDKDHFKFSNCQDNLKIGKLLNVHELDIQGTFDIIKGQYFAKLYGDFYNPTALAMKNPYTITITFQNDNYHVSKQFEIFHLDNSNGLFLINSNECGKLTISIKESSFFKKQVVIHNLTLIPKHIFDYFSNNKEKIVQIIDL